MPASRGRPRLPDEERRTLLFRVRLNQVELDLIRRAAKAAETTQGKWARQAMVRAAAQRLRVEPPE